MADVRGLAEWSSLTHQQMYYTWVERAWRGGQRIMVADVVNNNVLCSLPTQVNRYSCDDMDTVRRQIAETKKLEAFVDQQYGGTGKGWFRIAYSADEARAYVASRASSPSSSASRSATRSAASSPSASPAAPRRRSTPA